MQPTINPDPNNNYYPQQQLPQEEALDFRKYLFLLLSNWYWFGLTIALGMGTAYLVNRYSNETWQLRGTLIVGEQRSNSSVNVLLNELTPLRRMNRQTVVENELSILKSYSMALRTIRELDFDFNYFAVGRRNIVTSPLYASKPFEIIPDTTIEFPYNKHMHIIIENEKNYTVWFGDNETRYKGQFGQWFQQGTWNFKLDTTQFFSTSLFGNEYFVYRSTHNSLANQYRARLNVQVNSERGSIVSLSMTGLEKQQVADYLNTLMDEYIQMDLEEKNRATINSIEFIDEQIKNVTDSLEIVGLQLQRFRSDNQVIDLTQEGQILFEQLREFQNQKAQLEIQNEYYDYLLDYVSSRENEGDIIAPSVVGIDDPLMNSLVQQINQLYIEKQEMAYTMQPGSPAIRAIETQLQELRASLVENVTGLVSNNQRTLNAFSARVQQTEQQLTRLPATEREFINIQREFDINNEIYTFLLEKRAEAGITKASNTSDHAILDPVKAENATKTSPNNSQNYVLGFILGLFIPLGIIVLREFLDNSIHGRHDIEKITSTPYLGSIGHNAMDSEIPVNDKPRSSLAESFRAIRSNLNYMLGETQKVVLITSTMSGEGKTFCALNLATIVATSGKKTLLLGLDLRKPHLHQVFNVDNSKGISQYLAGQSTYEELVLETNIQNLWIAPSGPMPPNPAELVGRREMEALIQRAREDFDFVVMDTPPVGVVADGLELTALADSSIFVVRQRYSPMDVLKLIEELRSKREIKNMAILLNDVTIKGHYGNSYRYTYGYGYHYAYGHAYGYYEEDAPQLKLHEKIMKWITSFRK